MAFLRKISLTWKRLTQIDPIREAKIFPHAGKKVLARTHFKIDECYRQKLIKNRQLCIQERTNKQTKQNQTITKCFNFGK